MRPTNHESLRPGRQPFQLQQFEPAGVYTSTVCSCLSLHLRLHWAFSCVLEKILRERNKFKRKYCFLFTEIHRFYSKLECLKRNVSIRKHRFWKKVIESWIYFNEIKGERWILFGSVLLKSWRWCIQYLNVYVFQARCPPLTNKKKRRRW